ncbi:23S rRNA (cytidine(2498)-2'-O)-methyltransferase RlmM [Candidatus Nitrotoga sp. M5]|uniref:23S rRNA (cytidine(2498)-2'-O)-methyltransferase RlmM n=1 Tax=Candidatus Nitrotoga sp. M5 TaxID=2890409 RepID=UPI001EF4F2F6|nr:23S rRNA (cytidine(2498)-2'-O)-methyltransferase RlmM [Candidatus Nitrotoga sp. M5]
MSTQNSTKSHQWLLYCRPGFERDCLQETLAVPLEINANSGFLIIQNKPRLHYDKLTFTRQLITLLAEISELPDRDRLTPLLAAIPDTPAQFSALWLETPDTNDGKTLSGFIKRFQPLLEEKLRARGRMTKDPHLPRLHIFFPDKNRVLIGASDPRNSATSAMGILRMKMPYEAPSRSVLKLAEAFETFLSKDEKFRWIRHGMRAVDLGAAPGGWTWHLVRLGMQVEAVDNGPLKGVVAEHPSVKHQRQDGFRYRPKHAVDWLVCDMIEQPRRVAALVADWVASGSTNRAIFNLKLPMKKRLEALNDALASIRAVLDKKGFKYRLQSKQLYHDREEVTVFLARIKL